MAQYCLLSVSWLSTHKTESPKSWVLQKLPRNIYQK